MKSRSSTFLTVFAFGVAIAALAPRLLRAFGGRAAAPMPAPATRAPRPAARPAEPAVQAPAPPPAFVEPPPAEPAVTPQTGVEAGPVTAPSAFPWLEPSAAAWQQPTPAVAPSGWPAPTGAPPWAAATAPTYVAPAPPPWGQPYAAPPPPAYARPVAEPPPYSRGWAPPGTYAPPQPPGGYAYPPNVAPAYAPPTAPPPPPRAEPTPPAPPVSVVPPDVAPIPESELEANFVTVTPRRRWFTSISSLIGIFLLIAVVATLLFITLAPRLLGWQFVTVAGGSMEPAVHIGAVAVMEKVQPQDLKVGDIIMFSDPAQPGRRVTHRIITVKDNGGSFTTRGDANKTNDATAVPGQLVQGRFLFSIPAAGRFVAWMNTQYGFLMMIFVPGIIIILWELRNLAKGRQKPQGGGGIGV